VLRSVLARHGWPPNRVLGGNNLSFWPLGTIARRSGIVFIRRSFKDAPVYKAMLREYLAYLLSRRFNVEWYIEGGRTRTGKLRPPRYGLLRYVVDALASGAVRDVVLVPVSIVYDSQTEVPAIAAEQLGAEKEPEGIRWMLRHARSRARTRSVVHLRFGRALSLREALEQGAGGAATDLFTEVDVAKVAFEVCHRINDATPITPIALVTLALLAANGRALTWQDVQNVLDPLLAYVATRRLPTTRSVQLPGSAGLLDALVELTWAESLRLRDVLKFEFFFPRKEVFAEQVRAEVELVDPAWKHRERSGQQILRVLRQARSLFAPLVLRPLLEAYSVVAGQLAAQPPGVRSRSESCWPSAAGWPGNGCSSCSCRARSRTRANCSAGACNWPPTADCWTPARRRARRRYARAGPRSPRSWPRTCVDAAP
jgi:glycerol-3-phosphate O-acyltransferase